MAQDQVAELLDSTGPASSACAVSRSTATRRTTRARRSVTRGDIVVRNPDMLHQAILPHHTKWAQFFENLRYRRHRRVAHVSRRVRLAHGERAPAPARICAF
jgi:ATP-dependent helicase YprA (DUF1998 family)